MMGTTSVDTNGHRGLDWLESLDESARFSVENAGVETVGRGMAILRAGEIPRAVFIVREGGVKEVQTTPETEGGRDVIVALHGPGDFFGDLALMNDEPATTTTVALAQTSLIAVPRETWLELCQSPQMMRMLTRRTQKRLEDAYRMIRMLSRYTTEARLKSALLILAERWGSKGDDGVTIGLELTHRTLADLAGASREKVTRALGILSQKGLVKVVQRRLVVPSLERLLDLGERVTTWPGSREAAEETNVSPTAEE
jgi:CRP-like cAMP-binding protein